MPMVAKSVLLGGHVRVGLEDNLYLKCGVFASNGELVDKAIGIIDGLGARALTPAEGREKLGLSKPHRPQCDSRAEPFPVALRSASQA